ncbi:MAG TPA: transglycosylase family protein [Acidimicrobiales bacterium]|nr:transglycosylase family protein [Acidimicrobiales bacterium]
MLCIGACLVPPLLASSPAGAAGTTSLQAEAAQLSQQLIQEELQVDALEHQYELDTVRVAQDTAAVATVRAQVTRDQVRVRSDHVRLTNEAVSAYVNAGSTTANQTLQLFSANRDASTNRNEYETVVIGNTTETLAILHIDQVQLQATQAALVDRTQQDRSAQSAAANATARAQQVANELASKESLVKGQLAAAIAADRSQQTATAVVSRSVVGGAVTDPPLPPFLQCVLQAESGGDYQAVSPNGLYMGGFQFSQSTWNEAAQLAGLPQLIGVPPNDASKADQDTLAVALYNADGEQPWYDPCRS